MRLMSSESSHFNGGYEHTPTSYGEGTGSVLSPLGETSLSKMVGCSLFQVYFCCCDRTVKISLGGGRVYLAQNFRSQTITEGKSRQELKQLVMSYPWARAERNECILTCLHLTPRWLSSGLHNSGP